MQECGKLNNISATAVRQIIAKIKRLARRKREKTKPILYDELKNSTYITEEEKIKLINLEDEIYKSDAVFKKINLSGRDKEDSLDLTIAFQISDKLEDRKKHDEIEKKKSESIDSIKIESLEIPNITFRQLKRAGIDSLQDILKMKKEEFEKIRIRGYSLRGLISKIEEYGYVYGDETGFTKQDKEVDIKHKEGETQEIDVSNTKPEGIGIRSIYGLTPKTYSILENEGIYSLEELTKRNVKEISNIPYFRRDSFNKLMAKLKEMGYKIDDKGNFEDTNIEEEQNSTQTLDDLSNINLGDLGISDKIVGYLEDNEIFSLQNLAEMNEKKIRNIRGIGDKGFEEIMLIMQKHGYAFIKGGFVKKSEEIERKKEERKKALEEVEQLKTKLEEAKKLYEDAQKEYDKKYKKPGEIEEI